MKGYLEFLKWLGKKEIWYVIHGSYSLYLQGFKELKPNDVDIWVEKEGFYKITKHLGIKMFLDIPAGKQIQFRDGNTNYEVSYEYKEDIHRPVINNYDNIIYIKIWDEDIILPCLSIRAIQKLHNELYERGLIKREGIKYHNKAKWLSEQFNYKGGYR